MVMELDLRRVPWASSYLISDRGELYSERFGGRRRKIVPYIDKKGYAKFGITGDDGKRMLRGAHQLVCEAFNGPRPEGLQCRHLDGDPSNNTPGNLRWGTAKENAADRKAHGRDRSPRPRVPHEIVEGIKDVYFCENCNVTITRLAQALGLSREYVSDIINGKVRTNG